MPKYVNKIKWLLSLEQSYYFLLLIFCFASIFGLSGVINEKVIIACFGLYANFYIVQFISKKLYISYIVIIFLLALIYLPQSILYGELHDGIVIALLATNYAEATEYVQGLPILVFLIPLLYIFLFIAVLYSYNSIGKFRKDKTYFVGAGALLLVIILLNPLLLFINYDKDGALTSSKSQEIGYYKGVMLDCLEYSNFYPLAFTAKFSRLTLEYNEQKKQLEESKKLKPTWKVISAQPKHNINVLIIGESVRRDYMSLYGYPVDTTPFLNSVNSLAFDNYISAASGTVASLERSLFLYKDDNIEYNNSIVSLANSAGFETYWLSNQGMLGENDTLLSSVAIKSDHTFFAKKGSFKSNNKSDYELFPAFKKAVNDGTNKDKLIVLHLLGSHTSFCKRLDSRFQIDNFNNVLTKKLDCYLSSIKQTDKLINLIYDELRNSKKSFSILYFADHGLTHNTGASKSDITLLHSEKTKANYNVPLVVISDDMDEKKHIQAFKSGFNFLKCFTEWLGIEEKGLAQRQLFFQDKQTEKIKVYDYSTNTEYDKLNKDLAITPSFFDGL